MSLRDRFQLFDSFFRAFLLKDISNTCRLDEGYKKMDGRRSTLVFFISPNQGQTIHEKPTASKAAVPKASTGIDC
jgi:hypothetical protein